MKNLSTFKQTCLQQIQTWSHGRKPCIYLCIPLSLDFTSILADFTHQPASKPRHEPSKTTNKHLFFGSQNDLYNWNVMEFGPQTHHANKRTAKKKLYSTFITKTSQSLLGSSHFGGHFTNLQPHLGAVHLQTAPWQMEQWWRCVPSEENFPTWNQALSNVFPACDVVSI